MSQDVAWAPIATAPENGSPVWVRGNNYGNPKKGQYHCWAWWDAAVGAWFDAQPPGSSRLRYLTHWLPQTEAAGAATDELRRCRELLGALYQILGAHGASDEVLDAVSNAADGAYMEDPAQHLLPYTPPSEPPPYSDLPLPERILSVLKGPTRQVR